MTHKLLFILVIVAVLILTAACGNTSQGVDLPQFDSYQVDIDFREFYDLLGGQDTLGPAISPVFENQDAEYQYTQAALMVREPQASGQPNFRLAGLGLDFGIAEPPVVDPDQSGVRYINGHIIYEGFIPLYEKLGGARYVGKPITEVHFNPEKGRYEQFFENLGFYRLEKDSPGEAHLLAFGALTCNSSCRQRDLGAANFEIPFRVGKPFQDAVARLGPNFTGFAISELRNTPDNYIEQVYENLVLVIPSDETGRVFLRPITESLGIRPDKPVDRSDKEGFIFIPVKGEKGYFVYQKFMDYIAQHGGLDAAGEPINELVQVDDHVNRQCFTNLCLEESRYPSGATEIRPASLGYSYRLLPPYPVNQLSYSPVPEAKVNSTPAPEQELAAFPSSQPTEAVFSTPQARELIMRVWKTYPMISPDQNQEIGVSIMENNAPLRNLEPYLIITYPDEQGKTYYMDLTAEDGSSHYVLDPINAPNGTLIPYQVCILDLNNEKFCVKDSFMIWQNQ